MQIPRNVWQFLLKAIVSAVCGCVFAVLSLAFAGMMLVLPNFSDVTVWRALEHVGTSPALLPDDLKFAVWRCYAIGAAVFVVVAALYFFASGWFWRRFGAKGVVALNCSFLVFLGEGLYATFEYADACFNLRYEMRCRLNPSKLFADEFARVAPGQVDFPVKRNLVVLVGESIEESFVDGSWFGENVMPRLSKWRSRHDSFGTMCSVHGCDHTICALFGMAYGAPRLQFDSLLRPVSFSDYPEVIMPSVWSVWLRNGFNCRFVQGGELKFACTDKVFKAVPEVEVHDMSHFADDPDYLKERSKLPFGVNDEVVIAKRLRGETLELARRGKPFVLVAWTLNTHCSGWVSALKPRRRKTVLADSVAQADDMIVDYLEWLERQPFAADTQIVFLGDHVAHLKSEKTPKAKRHPVNAFASKSVPPIRGKRTFAAFDLAPTFLELTGAKLENGRFGVGTSLLGESPTLLERVGLDRYESEMRASGLDYRRIAFGW